MSGVVFQLLLAAKAPFKAQFTASGSGSNSFNVSIGDADASRILVIATSDAAGTPINSVTVDGNSATQRVSNTHAQIWTIPWPTGTTATVAVSSSSNTLNGIAVYALYNAKSETPDATATGTTSVNINVNAGGAAIASYAQLGGASNVSWSGVTEDYEATVGSTNEFGAASASFSTAQSPLAISLSNTAGTTKNLAAAAWS